MQNIHAHVNSFSRAQNCVHEKVYFFILFYFRDSVCCHFDKSNDKNPDKIKNIYRWLYYIPNIKVKIMLYEPYILLNVVWKSTERFGNLSLEKYGILKWKMCRNPV